MDYQLIQNRRSVFGMHVWHAGQHREERPPSYRHPTIQDFLHAVPPNSAGLLDFQRQHLQGEPVLIEDYISPEPQGTQVRQPSRRPDRKLGVCSCFMEVGQ